MKKRQSRIFLIITGLLTATIILFSQLFYTQAAGISKKEVKTEQTEDKDVQDDNPEDLILTTAPSISFSSSSTIEVEKEQTFIFEILHEQGISFPTKVETNRTTGKLFKHLFRVIISPNAP